MHTGSRCTTDMPLLLLFTGVDDIFDTGDGEGRLCDVRGKNAFTIVRWCRVEDSRLLLVRQRSV